MLKKTQRKSLVFHVVQQIEDAILNGEYNSGEKLPSMNELQEIIGTSQGTIREAFCILSQKGLIDVKVGVKGGAYVKEFNTRAVEDWLSILIRKHKLTYKEIAKFRTDVEVGLIKIVTEKANKNDIKNLNNHLTKLEKYSKIGFKAWSKFIEVEKDFRKNLISIADNYMYEAILLSIYDFFYSYALQLDTYEETTPDLAYIDFKNIVSAIKNGDSSKASELTVNHIERYINAISKKIDA